MTFGCVYEFCIDIYTTHDHVMVKVEINLHYITLHYITLHYITYMHNGQVFFLIVLRGVPVEVDAVMTPYTRIQMY